MNTPFTYHLMRQEEVSEVCALVNRVFSAFVAPMYAVEGVQEFLSHVQPEKLLRRLNHNHTVVVAEKGARLVGMIEMRNSDHVSLFFVEGHEQGKGIGRGLMNYLIEMKACEHISVHASPNSTAAYETLGFTSEGPLETKNGITYMPMKKM